jgi:hypothetical protein
MASKYFSRFVVLFLILAASLSGFAQTQPLSFASYAYGLEDPKAAFSIGIFNPAGSGKTIYLKKYEVHIGFDATDTTGYVIIGTSFGTTLPQGGTCTGYKIMNLDLTDPGEQVASGSTALSVARLIGQPCTGGTITTTNLGTNTETTILNHAQTSYVVDLSSSPYAIPPGKAFVVYVGNNFLGGISAGFKWDEK